MFSGYYPAYTAVVICGVQDISKLQCHLCFPSPCVRAQQRKEWNPNVSPSSPVHLCFFPSMLVVEGKGDCGCRYELYSSARILAKLRCGRPGLRCSAHSLESVISYHVDGSRTQITDTVIPEVIPWPSWFSGQPLVTHRWFPAGRTFPGASVYSVSSKKSWSGKCSLQNLVGAHIEQMSQKGWRAEALIFTSKITKFSSLHLPTSLLSHFTNLEEPSASLVPARTARKTARSCSISTWTNDGMNRTKKRSRWKMNEAAAKASLPA